MSTEEFKLFRTLLLEAAGLTFDENARERLERRIVERLAHTGARDFTDYYLRLKRVGGMEELERMLELCVTHETYFFREPRQLRSLEEEVLPALADAGRGRRTLRIWSAGCSTGEEAYTLAIILHRSPVLKGWHLEVLGTDISHAVLSRARRGIYGPSSFRDIDATVKERYFRLVSKGLMEQWEIRPEIKNLVTYGRVNLWSSGQVASVGMVDVVLCRNVLIYFDRDARRQVIERLHHRLRPGGFLLLGHSENLLQTPTPFETVSMAHDLVYRRTAPGGLPGQSWRPG